MKLTCIISLLMVGFQTAGSSALIAMDDASGAAYAGGWENGVNGGTGFAPWSIDSDEPNSGAQITSTPDFSLFASNGASVTANRALSSELSVGQTLSANIFVNFRNGNKGFSAFTFDGVTELFNLNVGGDSYDVNNVTTGGGQLFNDAEFDSDTRFLIELTQDSASGGSWTVTRSGGLTGQATGTYTGVVGAFRLYNSGADNNDVENQLLANDFQVIPEPSSILLGSMGLLAILRRRRSS